MGPVGEGEVGANWGRTTDTPPCGQELAGGARPGDGEHGSALCGHPEAGRGGQEGGSRGKGRVYLQPIHVVIRQKPTLCKATLLQLNVFLKKMQKKKRTLFKHHPFYEAFLDQAPPPRTMPTPHPAHHSSLVSPQVPLLSKGRAYISFTLFTRF